MNLGNARGNLYAAFDIGMGLAISVAREKHVTVEKVSVGFVGAGNMAQQHARALAAIENVKLTGVVSRTRARSEALAEEEGIANVFDGIDEMYEAERPDLCVIAVKELGMQTAAAEAAKHEWVMFLEKPAGYRLDIAEAIRTTIKTAGRRAFVGFNRRHYSATKKALEIMNNASGPRHIHVMDQQSPALARKIGHAEDVIEHFMYANSIHLIDYFRTFGRGEIVTVTPDRRWSGLDTFAHGATIEFSSGDFGRYDAIWGGPGPWACYVTCPERRVEMRPLEQLTVQTAGSHAREPVEIDDCDSQFKAGFYSQAAALIAALRNGGSDGLVDIDQSFEVMELIHRIYEK